MTSLSLVKVGVSHGGLRVLREISLDFCAPSIVALIGENGSGKTSLLNVISGVLVPDVGEVFVGGIRINRLKPYQVARLGVARTFQEARVIRQVSVWENIALGMNVTERHSIAQSLMSRLGITGLHDIPAGALSYGQQRLVSIVRALASESPILLLDEPTAGLQPSAKRRVAELLLEMRAHGRLALVVEHDLDFVREVADRVVVLDAGRCVSDGPMRDVMYQR